MDLHKIIMKHRRQLRHKYCYDVLFFLFFSFLFIHLLPSASTTTHLFYTPFLHTLSIMNQNTSNQSQSDSAQRSSHQQQESKASALKQQQLQEQRSETPSHAGQSNIEAPMSGSKMCGHAFDCDCSTETAIHASEEHAPRTK